MPTFCGVVVPVPANITDLESIEFEYPVRVFAWEGFRQVGDEVGIAAPHVKQSDGG
jgi:hypothetical protein